MYLVNKDLSFQKLSEEAVLLECDNDFKLLNCDANILIELIKTIKETGHITSFYEKYSKKFSREEITEFIDVLLSENIISKYCPCNKGKLNVALVGTYRNINLIKKYMPDQIYCKYEYFIDKTQNIEINNDIDCVIFAPEYITYEKSMELNKLLLDKDIPYFVFRYSGNKFILGPFVIPYKGACLECCLTQKKDTLSKLTKYNLNKHNFDQLCFSKNWPKENLDNTLSYFVNIISQEISKLLENNIAFQFYDKEVHFDLNELMYKKSVKYVPTSSCEQCRGMNKKVSIIKNKNELQIPVIDSPLKYQKIRYKRAGLRSLSTEETKSLIDNSLKKLGLGIKIYFDQENHFKDVIPVYHSLLEGNHKNRTPYYFGRQFSHGKGINEQQAYFSAAFEIFERLSARYFGEIPLIRGNEKNLGSENCIDMSYQTKVIPFIDHDFTEYTKECEIDWVWGYSITDNRPKLIPADIVFFNNIEFKGKFAGNGSSGLSAGSKLEDAILQGLWEVVEHDSWIIGQSRGEKFPLINHEEIKSEKLKIAINKLKQSGLEVITRDYTNDLGIPVYCTWIKNINNYEKYASQGFGCSIYPEIAIERSVTEAVQGINTSSKHDGTINFEPKRYAGLADSRNSLYKLYYFNQYLLNNCGEITSIERHLIPDISTVSDAILYTSEKIKAVVPDAEILYVNLTRQEIGIPVVKVIVNGLQLFQEPIIIPNDRLYPGEFSREKRKEIYENLYLGSFPH